MGLLQNGWVGNLMSSYTGDLYSSDEYGNGFGSGYTADMSTVSEVEPWTSTDTTILIVVVGLVIVSLIFSFISYIFYAIGMYGVAKTEGYDKPWLAWVPIANSFMIPILMDKYAHPQIRGKFVWIYLASILVGFFLSLFISIAGYISTIVLGYGFYLLAKRYSERPVLHLVVGVVTLTMAVPFQIFRFRKRQPVE